MGKYEEFKNKSKEELNEIIENDYLNNDNRIVASLILAESEEGYDINKVFDEILDSDRNKKIG